MAEYQDFHTPTPTKWERRGVLAAIFLMLVVSWGGLFMCTTAKAQSSEPQKEEEPKVEEVLEESTCNRTLEKWNGSQLVSLQIDPESLAAQAAYFKKLEGNKAILFVLIRPSCEAPWKAVKAIPLEMKPPKPKCVDTETSKCL